MSHRLSDVHHEIVNGSSDDMYAYIHNIPNIMHGFSIETHEGFCYRFIHHHCPEVVAATFIASRNILALKFGTKHDKFQFILKHDIPEFIDVMMRYNLYKTACFKGYSMSARGENPTYINKESPL